MDNDAMMVSGGAILKEIYFSRCPKENEKDALKARFHHSYQKGYQFHQNAVHQNPELLDWILRKDYWNYKLPPELNITHD